MNQKKWMKKGISLLAAVALFVTTLESAVVPVKAANVPVEIEVIYGQTEARSMLSSINTFRASSTDAWYWNEDDTQKVYQTAGALTYDYELEKAAMKRAAEVALSFAHTRPNGESCFTAYASGYGTRGENIAIGQTSAAQVFTSWQETNDKYSGQGHRRNMLSRNYSAIGIGHVKYQGLDCWVQEFADVALDPSPSTANDSKMTVTVDVAESNITSVDCNLSDISLKVGETKTVDNLGYLLKISGFWSYKTNTCAVKNACSVKRIDDTTVASYANGTITAVKEGTTKIWISNPFGEDISRTITVSEGTGKTLEADTIKVSTIADQEFTGKEIKPSITVMDGKTALVKDKDYTVAYKDNINAGKTAKVTITGKGDYTGSIEKTFVINPKALTNAVIATIEDQTYLAKAITPEVKVSLGGATLVKDKDFTVTYSNNVEVGKATVKISGKGNYKGEKTTFFNIVEEEGDISPQPSKTATPTKAPTAAPTAAKIAVNATSVKLTTGKSFKIKVTQPSGVKKKISYKSSNKKIATVNSKGVIKAKKAGTVKITIQCGSTKKVIKVKIK